MARTWVFKASLSVKLRALSQWSILYDCLCCGTPPSNFGTLTNQAELHLVWLFSQRSFSWMPLFGMNSEHLDIEYSSPSTEALNPLICIKIKGETDQIFPTLCDLNRTR